MQTAEPGREDERQLQKPVKGRITPEMAAPSHACSERKRDGHQKLLLNCVYQVAGRLQPLGWDPVRYRL